jgi:hypothetical protein
MRMRVLLWLHIIPLFWGTWFECRWRRKRLWILKKGGCPEKRSKWVVFGPPQLLDNVIHLATPFLFSFLVQTARRPSKGKQTAKKPVDSTTETKITSHFPARPKDVYAPPPLKWVETILEAVPLCSCWPVYLSASFLFFFLAWCCLLIRRAHLLSLLGVAMFSFHEPECRVVSGKPPTIWQLRFFRPTVVKDTSKPPPSDIRAHFPLRNPIRRSTSTESKVGCLCLPLVDPLQKSKVGFSYSYIGCLWRCPSFSPLLVDLIYLIFFFVPLWKLRKRLL